MANKLTHRKKAYSSERVDIDFSFVPNTASAPATTGFDGDVRAVSTVVHTATGRWTITLRDAFPGEPVITCSLQLAASNVDAAMDALYVAASKTIELRYKVAGTLTDLASTAGNRLGFKATFRNSLRKKS